MEGKDEGEARAAGQLWLKTRQAAAFLGFSYNHLKRLRHRGEGPPCRRFGVNIRYNRDELRAWSERQPAVVAG